MPAPQQSAPDTAPDETSLRVMRLLDGNPDLTQRELAEALGVSVGAVNFCLKALIAKGFVKMQNFGRSKNKFKYIYLLTPAGIAERTVLTHHFLQRKLAEYDALKREIALLRAEVAAPAPTLREPDGQGGGPNDPAN